MSDNIHVAIRVRPLIERERNDASPISWHTQDTNRIFQVDKKGQPVPGAMFMFDSVFSTESPNREVYEKMCHPIVESVTDGFHGTVFAYGQTSSGKTYTMMGRKSDPGVISMAVQDIFAICQRKSGRQFSYKISYMEIYNEKISDLIANNSGLVIKENIAGQVFVSDLEAVVVTSVEEVFKVMQRGEKNRHFGCTSMNDRSSRSHTIFKMVVESKLWGAGVDSPLKVSQLNLVDLAGSEKAGQMGTTGDRFKEGVCINKSLLTLSQVISNLSEGAFVNYRDSKLTRILQNSLGGNSRTAIICTVTPAVVDQTLSTLNFAYSAKRIQNKPVINEVLTETAQLRRAQREIVSLKKEIFRLRNVPTPSSNLMLEDFHGAWGASPSSFATIPENSAVEKYFEAPSSFVFKETLEFEQKHVTKRRKTNWASSKPNASFLTPDSSQDSQDFLELQKQCDELAERNSDLQQQIEFLKEEASLRGRDSFPDKEVLKHDLSDYRRKTNVLTETLRNRDDLIKDLEETVKTKDCLFQELEYTIIEREVQQSGTYFGERVTFSPIAPRGFTVKISTCCQTDDPIIQAGDTERTESAELLKLDADTQTVIATTCIALQTQSPITSDCFIQTDTKAFAEAFVQTVNEISQLDCSTQITTPCTKFMSSQTINAMTLNCGLQTDEYEAEIQKEYKELSDFAVQTTDPETQFATCQTDLPLTVEIGSQTGESCDPMLGQTFVDPAHSSVKEVDALNETVLELEEEIDHWKGRLEDYEGYLEDQQAKIKDLEKKLAIFEAAPLTTETSSQTEFPDSNVSSPCDIEVLKETIQELEEEIEHWKDQLTIFQDLNNEEIQNKLLNNASNNNHLEKKLETSRLELSNMYSTKHVVDHTMVESLQSELRELYTAKLNAEQFIETLQSQVLTFQGIAEEKSKECDLMSLELTNLHTKFLESQPAIKAAVKEATKHKTNSLELQVEYKQLLKKNEDLHKRVEFYQTKVREAENKLRRANTQEMDNTVVHLRSSTSSTSQAVGMPAPTVIHEQEDLSASCGMGYISKFRISMLEKELKEVKIKHNRLVRILKNCSCSSLKTSADIKENLAPTPELSQLSVSSKETKTLATPVAESTLHTPAFTAPSTLAEVNSASQQRNSSFPRFHVPSSSGRESVPQSRLTPVPHSNAQISSERPSLLGRPSSQDILDSVGNCNERQRPSSVVSTASYQSPLPKSQVPLDDFTLDFSQLPKPKKPIGPDNSDGCATQ